MRALASEILKNEKRLDVLINNAGIANAKSPRETNGDGFELHFTVNYLAPYLLTKLLLPLLTKSAPSRIVNVSSLGQQAIDFDDPMIEKNYSGMRGYCQSKLAQISMTMDMAPDLKSKNVTINALHPATYMATKIVPSPVTTIDEGMRATVRLAIDPELDHVTGKFFDGLREAKADAQAYDRVSREKLRAISDQLIT